MSMPLPFPVALVLTTALLAPHRASGEGLQTDIIDQIEKDILTVINFDESVIARTTWGAVIRGDFTRDAPANLWDGQVVQRGAPRFMKGKFGKAIYLERGATNFFPRKLSNVEIDTSGFIALGDGKLSHSTAHQWEGKASLDARAGKGGGFETREVFTHTVPIHGHEPFRMFTASVYLRGERGGEKVVLRLADLASLKEAAPKLYAQIAQKEEADKDQAKDDLDALDEEDEPGEGDESESLVKAPKSPFDPTSIRQQITLTSEWKRYYARVQVPRQRTRHRLRFSVVSSDKTPNHFYADGFQLEQSGQYPHHHVATTWMPGRTIRPVETLTFPLKEVRFPAKRGAISAWINSRSWWGQKAIGGSFLFSIGARNKPVYGLPQNYRVTVKGGGAYFNVKHRPTVNEFHHFALNWDAETFELFIDGQSKAKGQVGDKPIVTRLLHIGRNCSDLQNANALIDEFAIFRRPLSGREVDAIHNSLRPLRLKSGLALEALQNRWVFFRDEARGTLRFKVHPQESLRRPVRAQLLHEELPLPVQAHDLRPDAAGIVTFEFAPRRLTAARYSLFLKLSEANENRSYSFPVTVVPALNPHRYLTQFWQGPTDEKNLEAFGKMGLAILDTSRWASDESLTDRLARRGIQLCAHVGTLRPLSPLLHPDACIVTQKGVSTKRLCANHPDVISAAADSIRRRMEMLKPYPHVKFSLLNSEVNNSPCFAESCMERMKSDLGFTWPEKLHVGTGGRVLFNAKEEPAPHVVNGVVKDDNPYYLTLKWRHGPGSLSPHHQAVAAALKEVIDAKTIHDPAFRLPWVHTRTDGVDVIQHWSYSLDLERILLHIRAMQCDAQGKRMTSMILGMVWPRSTYERNGKKESVAQSPDYLRESMWLVLSQPVDILSFWAWRASPPPGHEASYKEVERMFTEVVVPYGPAIRKMKAIPNTAATLYSTCSQLFYQYPWFFTWGNTGAFNSTLLKHNVPLDIIYEQDILDGALDRYETLFLPVNVALPESVYRRIVEFADRGKLVVGDKFLKATIPGAHILDIHLGKPHYLAPVKTIVEKVSAFCPEVKQRLKPYVDTSTPDVFVAAKEYAGARYVFVINDRRHAGTSMDYTGNPKLAERCRPDGLAQNAEIVIRTRAPVIYDVLSHKTVPFSNREGGAVKLSLAMGTSEGKMLAIYPEPINDVSVAVDGDLRTGGSLRLTAKVLSVDQTSMPGTQPLRVDIVDSKGRRNDYSGNYATDRGLFELEVPIALNEPVGKWKVTVRELTTGLSASRDFEVR